MNQVIRMLSSVASVQLTVASARMGSWPKPHVLQLYDVADIATGTSTEQYDQEGHLLNPTT